MQAPYDRTSTRRARWHSAILIASLCAMAITLSQIVSLRAQSALSGLRQRPALALSRPADAFSFRAAPAWPDLHFAPSVSPAPLPELGPAMLRAL
jgi:hypothetical protein